MTGAVVFLTWAPGAGYSITQGEPAIDMLEIAQARLDRAEAAIYQNASDAFASKHELHVALCPPDVYQKLLAERRTARRDLDILQSIAVMLELVCQPDL